VAHRLLRLPGRDRLRWAEDARANQVDIRNRRRGLSQLVLRFGSNQVHLAETEEGVVVPVVLLHVVGIGRPLGDTYTGPLRRSRHVRNRRREVQRVALAIVDWLTGENVEL